MSSLIKLADEYLEIMKSVEENEGEITPEIEIELTKNLIESKSKVSGYVLMLNRFDAEIDFVNSQIKQAKEYCDKIKKQMDRLEQIALQVIETKGAKLEGESGNWISTRKSTAVEIFDENLVPPIYAKISVSIDKAAIKTDLANGGDVPGARMVERKNVSWK